MDFGGLAQFAPHVFVIQAPKLADDSYLVQSHQLHHGSSQSASPWSCLSNHSIFIPPSRLHRERERRPTCAADSPERQERKPTSAFELAAMGRKLGGKKISSRSQHVNIRHILESNSAVGGFFFPSSRCNLKCSLLRWHYQRRRFLFNPILQTSKGKSSLEGLWHCLSY